MIRKFNEILRKINAYDPDFQDQANYREGHHGNQLDSVKLKLPPYIKFYKRIK